MDAHEHVSAACRAPAARGASRRSRVARVRKWFDNSGYLTFGRFGRYEYHNSDQCILRARQVHGHIRAMADQGDPSPLELP